MNVSKRLAALLLAAALSLGAAPALAADAPSLPDVPPDAWYAEAVAYAAGYGLIPTLPDGSFGVGQPLAVREALNMVFTATAYRQPQNLVGTDTTDFFVALTDAIFAGERGDEPIKRLEFVQMLYFSLGNVAKTHPCHGFTDLPKWLLDYYTFSESAVNWAVEYGITSGTGPNTFSPLDPVTREQAAVMMQRCVLALPQ